MHPTKKLGNVGGGFQKKRNGITVDHSKQSLLQMRANVAKEKKWDEQGT